MEKVTSHNTIHSILIDLFSLHIVSDLIFNISSFFIRYCPFVHSHFRHLRGAFEVKPEHKKKKNESDVGHNKQLVSSRELSCFDNEIYLLGHDLQKVMEDLGIDNSFEGENEVQKRWGSSEISGIFEEEPSIEEVKEAFGVFDENKDGFIDAWELQRVLCVLGLWQGKYFEACSMMIREFDANNDGKIDFNDFVKLMLKSF
ncbi:hypothetical protein vseg_002756 [Gypsophila vaccaria]